MNTLGTYLIVAAVLFSLGLLGVLQRRNLIGMLISVELMLNGANINFISADGPVQDGTSAWRMRTYERGVEGETLACGTGAVAAGCAIQEWGLGRLPIHIQSRSGRMLTVRATKPSRGRYEDVWLAGEGRMVFRGVIT